MISRLSTGNDRLWISTTRPEINLKHTCKTDNSMKRLFKFCCWVLALLVMQLFLEIQWIYI